jgi:hypothetical protein
MDKAIVPHSKSTRSAGVQIADFIGACVRSKSYNSSAADKNAPSRQRDLQAYRSNRIEIKL